MSAVSATVQALLANAAVKAVVSNRVWPVVAPQSAAYPNIIVHRISESDDLLLRGHAGYPEARISVECRATTFTEADDLGALVIEALSPLHLAQHAGKTVSFRREGTDHTDYLDDSRTHRRVMDFYARWQ